ncbi:hypothetical protein AZI86_02120 [Bdellovibrio bacteriovorus]|uniref:N-acetyltransferase domain-containing protein n=2 Tax=Bdellovibrio bacteriovorus TaxID=959 RepID=A0A150WN56_BDEBC|nr:hypothetical protein AZI86_02120 [Bdellovibrio bacteriovorus]
MIRAMYKDLSNRGQFYIVEYYDTMWISIGDVTLAKDTMPIVIGNSRYRGKGIAKAVVLHLLQLARASKWEKITLKEIYRDNLASQKLYQSCGFKKISENDESFIFEIRLQ